MSNVTMNDAIEKLRHFINESGGDQKGYLTECLETALFEDHLTGLPNRMFFDMTLPRELPAAFRNGKQCAILMADVDNLKAINDDTAAGGHQKGDEAIKLTAHYLRNNVRRGDIVCRNSTRADEFLALFKSANARDAYYLGSSVKDIVNDDSDFTISGGVTSSDVVGVPLLYGERGRETISAFLNAGSNPKTAREKIRKYCAYSKKYGGRHKVLKMLGNVSAFIGEQYTAGKKLDPQKDFEEIATGAFVHYADRALLRAKEEGKNMIVAYDFGGFGKYTQNGRWIPLAHCR